MNNKVRRCYSADIIIHQLASILVFNFPVKKNKNFKLCYKLSVIRLFPGAENHKLNCVYLIFYGKVTGPAWPVGPGPQDRRSPTTRI